MKKSKSTKLKQTDRELLLSVFTFFEVPVTLHTSHVSYKHGSINAANRRYIFDDEGKIARIIENDSNKSIRDSKVILANPNL